MQSSIALQDIQGLPFRLALNEALQTLITQNAGPTEPSPTYAFQWWADTTTGILKQRNAANNDWFEILDLATGRPVGAVAQTSPTGALLLAEGTDTQRPAPEDIPAGVAAVRGNSTSLTDYFLELWNRKTEVWDALASRSWVIKELGEVVSVPVRQTVLSGPVDTSGFPNFLPSTAVSLSITTQGLSATPLVVAAAAGFGSKGAIDVVAKISADVIWPGLTASATNFLFIEIEDTGAVTTGATTLEPVYQQSGSRSTVSGRATFNVAEMSMTVGNDSIAEKKLRVYIGEAVTNSSSVVSTVSYAYQGKYQSTDTAISAGTYTNKNHNLGVKPTRAFTVLTPVVAEAGYGVGDYVFNAYTGSSASLPLQPAVTGRNTCGQAFSGALGVANGGNGASSVITPGNWRFRIFAERGW